jgi:hypothetical protein
VIPSPPSEIDYVPQAGKQVQEQRDGQGSIEFGAVPRGRFGKMQSKRLHENEPLFFARQA